MKTCGARCARQRDRIDTLDARILDLLSQRARAARAGKWSGPSTPPAADGPVLRPET